VLPAHTAIIISTTQLVMTVYEINVLELNLYPTTAQ